MGEVFQPSQHLRGPSLCPALDAAPQEGQNPLLNLLVTPAGIKPSWGMFPWANASHFREDTIGKEETEEVCSLLYASSFFLFSGIGPRRTRTSVSSHLRRSHSLTCASNLIKLLIAEVHK